MENYEGDIRVPTDSQPPQREFIRRKLGRTSSNLRLASQSVLLTLVLGIDARSRSMERLAARLRETYSYDSPYYTGFNPGTAGGNWRDGIVILQTARAICNGSKAFRTGCRGGKGGKERGRGPDSHKFAFALAIGERAARRLDFSGGAGILRRRNTLFPNVSAAKPEAPRRSRSRPRACFTADLWSTEALAIVWNIDKLPIDLPGIKRFSSLINPLIRI